jgi:hypothetical protein
VTLSVRKLTPEEWAAANTAQLEEKREAMRQWVKRNPQKAVASRLKWEAENPEKRRAVWRAHAAVKSAVKRGVLIKPDLCSRCGQHGRRIEAAHHDYTKPLEVTWLCSSCHHFEDRRNPKTKAVA